MLTCPPPTFPKQASTLLQPLRAPSPTNGLILCKADTPRPPPHGKINFLERRRFGLSPFTKPSALDLGHYNHLLGGHSCCKGCNPGFSPCPSPPLQIPLHQLAPTQNTVSSISPHGTLLINCSNPELKEETAQTLKPWELVNQELKFKTNALSCGCGGPPPFFFFFAVLLNRGISSEASTPSKQFLINLNGYNYLGGGVIIVLPPLPISF